MSNIKVIKLPASALEPERIIIYQCPYWDLLPPLSQEELDALADSIENDGIKTPLVVVSVMTDVWMVLDGWHRLSLAEMHGLYADDVPIHSIGEDQGFEEEDLHDLAVELNLRRRHLTPEARHGWILKLKRGGLSNRQIAARLDIDEKTVRNDLKSSGAEYSAPEKSGENQEKATLPGTVIGKDGKEYPATQPLRSVSKPKERTGPSVFDQAEARLREKKAPRCQHPDCVRLGYMEGGYCTEHLPKGEKSDEPVPGERVDAGSTGDMASPDNTQRRDAPAVTPTPTEKEKEEVTHEQAPDLPATGVRESQVGSEARGDTPVSSALVAHPTGLSLPVVGEAQLAEGKDDTAHTPVVAETERPSTQSRLPLVSQGEIALSIEESVSAALAKAGLLCPKHQLPVTECKLMACPHVKGLGETPAPTRQPGYQHWNTPQWLVDLIKQINVIALDPCHNDHSLVGATYKITKEENGLGKVWPWHDFRETGLVYVNPPYDDPMPWAERAVSEAAQGAEIVLCLPSSHSTRWYKLLRSNCQLLIQLGEKVDFGKEGVFKDVAYHETSLFYFGPQSIKVRAIMERAGHQVYAHKEYVAPKEEKQLGLPLEVTPTSEALTPPQEELFPAWFCLICGYSAVEDKDWVRHCKEVHGGAASASPITVQGRGCGVTPGQIPTGAQLRDWLCFGASAVAVRTGKDPRWSGLQDSVGYKVDNGWQFRIDQYGANYRKPKAENLPLVAPTPRGRLLLEWRQELIDDLAKCNYAAEGEKVRKEWIQFVHQEPWHKDEINEIFEEWKRTKPASKPYNHQEKKAPVPKRNKGKDEEPIRGTIKKGRGK